MKAGAFTILLTAVMTSMSFAPDGSAEAATVQAAQYARLPGIEPLSPVALRAGQLDADALGLRLVRNDHALQVAQIAMRKAISPAVRQFARGRYDQELVNRRTLLAATSPAGIRAALSGPAAIQLHAQAQAERSRLDHLQGPAFELAYLSDGLQVRPAPAGNTPAVLFAGR